MDTVKDRKRRKREERESDYFYNLLRIEEKALSMLKSFNVEDLEIELRIVSPENRIFFDYWRYSISSKEQSCNFSGIGRKIEVFVMDANSGGLLGIAAITDFELNNKLFDRLYGWEEHDREGVTSGIRNIQKLRVINTGMMIKPLQ